MAPTPVLRSTALATEHTDKLERRMVRRGLHEREDLRARLEHPKRRRRDPRKTPRHRLPVRRRQPDRSGRTATDGRNRRAFRLGYVDRSSLFQGWRPQLVRLAKARSRNYGQFHEETAGPSPRHRAPVGFRHARYRRGEGRHPRRIHHDGTDGKLMLTPDIDVLAEQSTGMAELCRKPSLETIQSLERQLRGLPQIDIETTHHFAEGIYGREIFIPAGTVLTGKIHRTDHLNFLMQGDITVWTDDGMKRLQAPAIIKASAGTKR